MANTREFLRGCILQRVGDTFGMYDFAYGRRNGAQDLSQVEARRDFARQVEEQLKPIVLSSYFLFCAHA
jgi:hypothetical protein